MKKILLIEDDENLRKLLFSTLTPKNFDVHEAADGEEGIAKILDIKPDLVLLDMLLPKLDGFHVLERLRTYPDSKIAKTHVIILSNLWSDKDILQAKALYVDEYYVKANTKIEEVVQKIISITNKN